MPSEKDLFDIWQGRLVSVLEGGYHVPADSARITRSGNVNVRRPAIGALASSNPLSLPPPAFHVYTLLLSQCLSIIDSAH
jgi:hypothetical protein